MLDESKESSRCFQKTNCKLISFFKLYLIDGIFPISRIAKRFYIEILWTSHIVCCEWHSKHLRFMFESYRRASVETIISDTSDFRIFIDKRNEQFNPNR